MKYSAPISSRGISVRTHIASVHMIYITDQAVCLPISHYLAVFTLDLVALAPRVYIYCTVLMRYRSWSSRCVYSIKAARLLSPLQGLLLSVHIQIGTIKDPKIYRKREL